MNYDNVKLWFAKNENGNVITIDDINDSNRKDLYSCPMCGSNLIPKAIKSKQITSHFAHVDASKCSNETMIHWWFKNKFIEAGDSFKIVSDKEREYVCGEVLIEQSYNLIDGKIYKPDVTIITECNNTIFFEMDYSNKKTVKDYIDIWIELKNIVVEVDVKSLMNKDKLPTFRALFYEGKCFNTKKSDTYYNMIGKYKEEKLKGNVDEELKDRIQKLDWFWDDIFRYKEGKVDIEHVVTVIDSIDNKDREIVEKILSKPKCIEIYEKYVEYKSNITFNVILSCFDSIYSHIDYEISNSKPNKSWRNKSLTAQIYFKDIKENTVTSYDIYEYSTEDIERKINSNIKEIIKRNKEEELLTFAQNSEIIKEVIKSIEDELKQIDPNYRFYDRFNKNCGVIASLYYNTQDKLDIRLEEDIIYLESENLIKEFLKERIYRYIDSIIPFENKELLDKNIIKIKDIYNNMTPYSEKIENRKKIAHKKWETYYEIKQTNYKIDCRYLAQNTLEIEIEKQYDRYYRANSSINTKIYIHNNELCSGRYYSSYGEQKGIVDKVIHKTFDKSWDGLEKYLSYHINELIKFDTKRSCTDCKTDFIMENGEIDFFIKKNLKFPCRCKECRKKRKTQRRIKY